ncbi:ATP-dependent Clp protease ATP-binding subunit [Candidatus Carsonella ruddii CS isolate Thao2000]|uniref:ATP-dependent Clp protease ATP-binding subunit n=1 Tax=Candidatus Carsonella ruddii CS isolate Thao2000 TaxID=1202537 RepID=J7GSL5_CARRU|nr:ATP-dependent Clp protease ATP-binding subunit ClpX [Candidatus Carsonella ruddii]AFP83747.1 ATP-dependent Clp protease ATP-binding subunit [Candidatus Carsonella ruddii CS isolate Thao2000]
MIELNLYLTPEKIKLELDKYIIGQSETKKILSVSVYNHYKRLYLINKKKYILDKSNILFIGPTGSGKTLMVKTLAKIINVPIIIVDATSFTEAGYVGEDVETIIQKLLHECDYNVELAEKSIIYIDEIDKISKKNDFFSGKDVSGEGVQQSLLKLIEGVNINITPINEKKINQQQIIFNINTNNILFIVGGAFSGIENFINNRINKELSFIKKINKNVNLINYTNNEDLINFGIIPEFLGRLPIVAIFKELNIYELIHILIKPKNSLLKQFCYLFIIEGVNIKFSFESIKEIARIAVKKKIGARGLKSILENILLNTMYIFPSKKEIKFIIIHKEVIISNKKPIFLYN